MTAHPTAERTARQIVQAFPHDEAPRFLTRDRDGIYGEEVQRHIRHMRIEQVLIAPRSPWQSPYVERLIGSIRRECLDHVIVLGEDHLRRFLSLYFACCHGSRTHLSLDRNAPEPRDIEPPSRVKAVAVQHVGVCTIGIRQRPDLGRPRPREPILVGHPLRPSREVVH